jgi:hypothetical protein
MSSNIIYDEKENYLKIKYSGYNNIEEFFISLEKAYNICRKNNYSNIILDVIDVDFNQVKIFDKYFAGEEIAKYSKVPNKIKIAVEAPKEYTNGFVDNVATNRGAFYKKFHKIKDAIDWVNE